MECSDEGLIQYLQYFYWYLLSVVLGVMGRQNMWACWPEDWRIKRKCEQLHFTVLNQDKTRVTIEVVTRFPYSEHWLYCWYRNDLSTEAAAWINKRKYEHWLISLFKRKHATVSFSLYIVYCGSGALGVERWALSVERWALSVERWALSVSFQY